MPLTVLIADDQPLVRQALAMAMQRVAARTDILEAGTLGTAHQAAQRASTLDLILLDLSMPGAVGYTGIALLHAERPNVPILVVSSAEGESVVDEVRAFGAVGFIGKGADLPAIEDAIRLALGSSALSSRSEGNEEGSVASIRQKVAGLTPMQLKVLVAVVDGKLNKQIAHSLEMSEATVKAHMTAIMRKLDVVTRTQAALVARSLGLEPKL